MREVTRRDDQDGLLWRCDRPCGKRIGFRRGTFFEHSHLSIPQIIDIIYHWSFDDLSCKKGKREFDIRCDHTTVE